MKEKERTYRWCPLPGLGGLNSRNSSFPETTQAELDEKESVESKDEEVLNTWLEDD